MPTTVRVPHDHPDVVAFVDALLREMAVRYDDDADTIEPTDPAASWVLLVDDDGTPAGCGAVQPLRKSVPDAAADQGEVKRVYVVPARRGRGLSRVVMSALVELATDLGYTYLQLETGTAQPEAIGLYDRLGWTRIDPYGQYVDDPRTVCFALRLSPGGPA